MDSLPGSASGEAHVWAASQPYCGQSSPLAGVPQAAHSVAANQTIGLVEFRTTRPLQAGTRGVASRVIEKWFPQRQGQEQAGTGLERNGRLRLLMLSILVSIPRVNSADF